MFKNHKICFYETSSGEKQGTNEETIRDYQTGTAQRCLDEEDDKCKCILSCVCEHSIISLTFELSNTQREKKTFTKIRLNFDLDQP